MKAYLGYGMIDVVVGQAVEWTYFPSYEVEKESNRVYS